MGLIEVAAALLVVLVGAAGAWLVLRIVVASTVRETRSRRAVIAGLATLAAIVAAGVAMVVWGPIVLLVVCGAGAVFLVASMPFVARSDIRRSRR